MMEIKMRKEAYKKNHREETELSLVWSMTFQKLKF